MTQKNTKQQKPAALSGAGPLGDGGARINGRFCKGPTRRSEVKRQSGGEQAATVPSPPSDLRLGLSAEVSSWQILHKQRDTVLQTPRN